MASTEGKERTEAHDLARLEAGLDALESLPVRRTPIRDVLLRKVFPPLLAVAFVLVVWQLLVWARVTSDYKLPSPLATWGSIRELWLRGELFDIVWNSVSRGLSGWLGLNDSMMYAVILLGAVPSIANGLIAGVDQIPPLYLRAGRTIGATGLRSTRHIVLPAALPGYLAGLKQGWAFSWRSLMAAEIIASSPDLGFGLGQLLENGRNNADMPGVFLAIILILIVGITIDLVIFCPLERWVLRNRGLLQNGSSNCRMPRPLRHDASRSSG